MKQLTTDTEPQPSIEYVVHECVCGVRNVALDYKWSWECGVCPRRTSLERLHRKHFAVEKRSYSLMILKLFAHSSILCFATKSEENENHLRISEQEFNRIWQNLSRDFGLGSTELKSVLITILCNNKEIFSLASYESTKWESLISSSLLESLRKRHVAIHDNNKTICDIFDAEQNIFLENALVDSDIHSLIFSPTSDPSFASLQAELLLNHSHDAYRLLLLVFSKSKELNLPKQLLSLLTWHKVLVTKCRYGIKKTDCRFLSVGTFIQQQPRERQNEIRTAFKAVVKTWSILRKQWSILKLYNSKLQDVGAISEETVLDTCIVKGPESHFYQVMKALTGIQNLFVENAMVIAASTEEDSPLSFMKPCAKNAAVRLVSIMDLRERHLIDFELENYESLLDFAQCGVSASTRRVVNYDFRTIQADIGHIILHGKPYIAFENALMFMEFKDDLYSHCVQLLQKISTKIPQREISEDLMESVRERAVTDPTQIPELLRLFGTLAILLDRGVQCSPSSSILDIAEEYVGDVMQIDYKRILPTKEFELSVSHLVSFYNFLEELNGENYLESLDEEFKIDLTRGDLTHIQEIICVRRPLVQLCLSTLKLFTHRFLYIRDNDISGHQQLSDFLSDPLLWKGCLQNNKVIVHSETVEESELDLEDIFPPSINVEHIYGVFDLLRTKMKVNIFDYV